MNNNNTKSVVLMVFHSVSQAQVVENLLSTNGVKCFLTNKEEEFLHSLYGNDSGIKLNVMEEDVPIAKEILTGDWSKTDINEE